MTWTSLHAEHAIERVRFEVHFAEPLPRKVVEQLGTVFDKGSGDTRFGPRQPQSFAKVVVGPAGPVVENTAAGNEVGWFATRTTGVNENAVEAANLQNSMMGYESTYYRGWDKAITRFNTVCGTVLAEAGRFVAASSVSLEYTDRFIFEGNPLLAKPDEIVCEEILRLLPESALSGRELWHVHRGWYETVEAERCLVNQNFDAHQAVVPSRARELRSIQIWTKFDIKPDRPGADLGTVIGSYNALHRLANDLVAASITPNMAKAIGLVRAI